MHTETCMTVRVSEFCVNTLSGFYIHICTGSDFLSATLCWLTLIWASRRKHGLIEVKCLFVQAESFSDVGTVLF